MILESFGKMSLSLDSQDLKLQKGLFLIRATFSILGI